MGMVYASNWMVYALNWYAHGGICTLDGICFKLNCRYVHVLIYLTAHQEAEWTWTKPFQTCSVFMRTVIVQATAAVLFKGNQGLSTRPTSSSSHLGKLPSSASFSALISQLSKRAINSLYTHVRHTGPRSRASSVLFVPPCGGQDFTASSEPYQFLLGKKNNPKGIMYFLFF